MRVSPQVNSVSAGDSHLSKSFSAIFKIHGEVYRALNPIKTDHSVSWDHNQSGGAMPRSEVNKARIKTEIVRSMLKTGEASRLLNIHSNTLRRWSEQGLIKAYRVGPRGDRRFRQEDVAALLIERTENCKFDAVTVSHQ